MFLLALGYQIWLLWFAAWSLPFCIFGLGLKPGAFLGGAFISRKLRSFSFLLPLPCGVVRFDELYIFCLVVGSLVLPSLLPSEPVVITSWRIWKSSVLYLSYALGGYGFPWCNKKL